MNSVFSNVLQKACNIACVELPFVMWLFIIWSLFIIVIKLLVWRLVVTFERVTCSAALQTYYNLVWITNCIYITLFISFQCGIFCSSFLIQTKYKQTKIKTSLSLGAILWPSELLSSCICFSILIRMGVLILRVCFLYF